MKKIHLCAWCINGIRSHGETVYIGDEVEETKCDFCDEEDDEVYECILD